MQFISVKGTVVAVPPVGEAQKPEDLDVAVISESSLGAHISRLKDLLLGLERAKAWMQVAVSVVEQHSLIPIGKLALTSGHVVHTSEVLCPLEVWQIDNAEDIHYVRRTSLQAACLIDRQLHQLQTSLAVGEQQALRTIEPDELVAGHYRQGLIAMLSSIKPTADANVSTIQVGGEEISYINEFEEGDVQSMARASREGNAATEVPAPMAVMQTYNKYLAMVESLPEGTDEFSAEGLQMPAAVPASAAVGGARAPDREITAIAEGKKADKKGVRFAAVENVREFEKQSSVFTAAATLETTREPRALSVPLDAFSGKVVERVQHPSIPAANPDATSTAPKKRVSLFKQHMTAAARGEHEDT